MEIIKPVVRPQAGYRFTNLSPKTHVHMLIANRNANKFTNNVVYTVPWIYKHDNRPVVLASTSKHIALWWQQELQQQLVDYHSVMTQNEQNAPASDDICICTERMDFAVHFSECIGLPLLVVTLISCDMKTQDTYMEFYHSTVTRGLQRR